MIELRKISKRFGNINAVDGLTGEIREGSVFGLVGTNGAGKSTCLRMMAGVLRPDQGNVLVDGQEIYENEEMKSRVFFISDDQYYLPNATPKDMMEYYRIFYSCFDEQRFWELMKKFGLDGQRRIHTFSRGMKKQLSVILGLCANTKYLLCDETFDGLDPVMRQAVKSMFALEIINRDFTPVIASHNLRELEDICDHVGLLHKGGILLSSDLEDLKANIHKVQCVVNEESRQHLRKELEIMQVENRGALMTFTAKGSREDIVEKVREKNPVFWEVLPLTLEEIFISETEVVGYDIKNLLL